MSEVTQEIVEKANEVLSEPGVDAKARKAVKKSKASKPKSTQALGDLDIGPKEYDRVVLPEGEDDPHWDPKLKNPVPEGLIEGMAEFGWDPSSRAVAIPTEDGKLKIVHGKTRWRALEKANRLRRANKLEAIVAHLTVVEEDEGNLDEVVRNMRLNVRLNRHVQEIDPMTLAESVVRALSTGQDERQVAKDHAISVNDLHGYLLLTDEDKCPAPVQEMLRQGQISFTAALELARRADKMSKSELTASAEQIAKVAAGGLKVTASQVKKAAGVTEGGPATQKEKKQFILDLQSGELRGKMGEACKWAAIVAMEVGLGTRTIDSAWSALGKLAQGQTIRVDFKQYVSDANVGSGMGDGAHASKPVKGQEAPKKKGKK